MQSTQVISESLTKWKKQRRIGAQRLIPERGAFLLSPHPLSVLRISVHDQPAAETIAIMCFIYDSQRFRTALCCVAAHESFSTSRTHNKCREYRSLLEFQTVAGSRSAAVPIKVPR
jgi:hypothetical protein